MNTLTDSAARVLAALEGSKYGRKLGGTATRAGLSYDEAGAAVRELIAAGRVVRYGTNYVLAEEAAPAAAPAARTRPAPTAPSRRRTYVETLRAQRDILARPRGHWHGTISEPLPMFTPSRAKVVNVAEVVGR